MRKIASNYIITPNGELLKYAYFIIYEGEICGCEALPNDSQECHGVEFYSGMLIPWKIDLSKAEYGESILAFIERCGCGVDKQPLALSLISRLDWSRMAITNETTVSTIV